MRKGRGAIKFGGTYVHRHRSRNYYGAYLRLCNGVRINIISTARTLGEAEYALAFAKSVLLHDWLLAEIGEERAKALLRHVDISSTYHAEKGRSGGGERRDREKGDE